MVGPPLELGGPFSIKRACFTWKRPRFPPVARHFAISDESGWKHAHSGSGAVDLLPLGRIIAVEALDVAILDERVLPWREDVRVLENTTSDGEPLFRFD